MPSSLSGCKREHNLIMKSIYLSYFINEQTPLYGGEKAIKIVKRSEISKGKSSNTKYLEFPNHTGTHIDFPNHFSDNGKTLNDYPASFWKFSKVYMISYPAKRDEIVDERILINSEIPNDTEFLILNTGFGKYRGGERYWKNNPGLLPQLADILRNQCPNLKVIGFDFISLSGYQNRILGRVAHKAFLMKNDILIVEDMKLDEVKGKKISSITALPLLIDKVDGVPVSIIAEIK